MNRWAIIGRPYRDWKKGTNEPRHAWARGYTKPPGALRPRRGMSRLYRGVTLLELRPL
jgi:hypothetical protein